MRDRTQVWNERRRTERLITGVGLTLSLVLSILLPVLAQNPSAQANALLGTSGFLVGYLLTMDAATRARLTEIETAILSRLGEVEEARFGALPLQRLLAVPDIEEAVCDVVTAAADARSKRMQFLANRTIERIQEDRDATLKIAQGIFTCADRRQELRLLRLALLDSNDSMKAVAGLGLEHWRTPEFQQYFATYFEASTHLRQTRIFLVTPEEATSPEMIDILQQHADAGVTTYAVNKNALPAELRRPMVLFDDSLLLLHSTSGSEGIDVQFTDDPRRVRDAREDFQSLLGRIGWQRHSILLWSSAHPVAPVAPVQAVPARSPEGVGA